MIPWLTTQQRSWLSALAKLVQVPSLLRRCSEWPSTTARAPPCPSVVTCCTERPSSSCSQPRSPTAKTPSRHVATSTSSMMAREYSGRVLLEPAEPRKARCASTVPLREAKRRSMGLSRWCRRVGVCRPARWGRGLPVLALALLASVEAHAYCRTPTCLLDREKKVPCALDV